MRRRCALNTSETDHLRDVAAILAKGYLRLAQKRRTSDSTAAASGTGTKSPAQGLEVSEKTVLSVPRG